MLQREPFCAKAQLIYQLCIWGDIELFVSDLTIVNTVYVAQRQKVPLDNIYNFLQEIRSHIYITEIGADAVDKAITTRNDDFEDMVQYYSAQNCNADYIVTRNKKDFPNDVVAVVTPDELIEIFYKIK